jgi:N-dimethylarginine dimethylaminohydrolase
MGNEIELVPVPGEEAVRFACNAVVVGQTVIMNTGCEKTARILEKLYALTFMHLTKTRSQRFRLDSCSCFRGYATRFVDMSEFIKSGGSAKCCTLELPSSSSY